MEPEEAFPYKAPDALTKKKYAKIFEIKETLKPRLFKLLFDKLASSIILIIASPILILIKVAYLVEGLIIPENSGPMFFFYNAVSGGKIIKKYKIRLIKSSFIDPELAKLNDWKAYSKEWSPKSRTYVGTFVKKFYLNQTDEQKLLSKNGTLFTDLKRNTALNEAISRGFEVAIFDDGLQDNSIKSVSYTHLTLPTNREV